MNTPAAKILVVEDEPGIAGFVRRGLIFEGYDVQIAPNGREALKLFQDFEPRVVVLDLMLPELDGLEVCRRIRAVEAAERRTPTPILMLTARDAIGDRVTGLESGADDYLVKPFAFEELLARVRALLRRAAVAHAAQPDHVLAFDDLKVDLGSRTAQRGDREVPLTNREFELLSLFLRHPNQVLPRSVIMDRVWGEDFYGDSNVLEVFVGNLRRQLEADDEPRLIQTIRGAGYVLRRTV